MCDEDVTLTVSATKAENLSYCWKKDGEDISDFQCTRTSTPTLTISKFLPDHQGTYIVMNNYDKHSVESQRAELALGKSLTNNAHDHSTHVAI